MIVADTSALLAVILGEDDAEEYAEALTGNGLLVGAATLVEAQIVTATRGGEEASRDLRLLLDACRATVVPVDAEHAARHSGPGNDSARAAIRPD